MSTAMCLTLVHPCLPFGGFILVPLTIWLRTISTSILNIQLKSNYFGRMNKSMQNSSPTTLLMDHVLGNIQIQIQIILLHYNVLYSQTDKNQSSTTF